MMMTDHNFKEIELIPDSSLRLQMEPNYFANFYNGNNSSNFSHHR